MNNQVVHSVVSGLVVGLFSILFYLSYAALIFAGPLAPWLAYGMAATFITGAIGGTLMALRSSLPFGIGGPDGSTSAVTAALVATLAAQMIAHGQQDQLLTATLVVLALSAALTGLLLGVLGMAHAGRAIRFVPYPVIGGFLGGSGLLTLMGAVQVLTGVRPNLASLPNLGDGASMMRLLAGLAVAIFLLAGRRYLKSPLAVPGQLLACILGFHLVLLVLGVPLEAAQQAGWTFAAPAVAPFVPPWTLDLPQFPWSALPTLAADLLAVMFVGTVSVLLNITSVELKTKQEADLDRELKVLGAANLLSAAMGGYVASLTSTRTNMNFALGRGARVPGLVVAGLSAAALFVQPEYIGVMPKCVLGGLLLTLGYDMVVRWLIAGARQLARLEYASLLAIAAIIVGWGFLPGVAIGVIFGCATFALSAGRVSAIKFAFDGSESLQLARPRRTRAGAAGRARPRAAGTQPAELPVLRLGQPALRTCEGAAGTAAGLPLPAVRFPPGHRHRFLGHAQLHPDQAGGRYAGRPAGDGEPVAHPGDGLQQHRVPHPRHARHSRLRPRAGSLRERHHRRPQQRRRRGGLAARLAHRGAGRSGAGRPAGAGMPAARIPAR